MYKKLENIIVDGVDYGLPKQCTHMLLENYQLAGVSWEGADLMFTTMIGIDLTGANLAYANLKNATLRRVTLNRANLAMIRLSSTFWENCKVIQANFAHSYATELCFVNTDLSGADFSYAVLRALDFENCNLSGANFSGADLRGIILTNCNLDNSSLAPLADNGYICIDSVVYHQLREDDRGYVLSLDARGEVQCGCRKFESVSEAMAHWSRPNYAHKVRGQAYVTALAFMVSNYHTLAKSSV